MLRGMSHRAMAAIRVAISGRCWNRWGIFILAFGFSMLVRNPPGHPVSSVLCDRISAFRSVPEGQSGHFEKPALLAAVAGLSRGVLDRPDHRPRFLLNTLTGLTTGYILITAILMMGDSHSVLEFWPILTAMGLAAARRAGGGLSECGDQRVPYPIWDSVWSIVTRPLFLISGTLILFRSLPKNIAAFLWYNPLIHITGEMRRGFYPMYDAAHVAGASELAIVSAAMFGASIGFLWCNSCRARSSWATSARCRSAARSACSRC